MRVREVKPELLDELPTTDPKAIRSRRDLKRVNAWMGHPSKIANLLNRDAPITKVLEIGSGDGRLMSSVLKKLPAKSLCVTLLDFKEFNGDQIDHRPGHSVNFISADVFDYLSSSKIEHFDAIVANLFLHHFEDDRLSVLLNLIQTRTDLLIACEPRRSAFSMLGCFALPLIGCGQVTCFDAKVSVRAGFCGSELQSLWSDLSGWNLLEQESFPFSHLFVARRKS